MTPEDLENSLLEQPVNQQPVNQQPVNQQPVNQQPVNQQPAISVIVPAWNGRRTIVDCLNSIFQAAANKSVEVLVIESSGDEAREIIKQQFPQVQLLLPPERLQVGAARNLGMSHASGELVFFVDQDCVVPTNWIDTLAPFFDSPAIGAVGGSIDVRNPGNVMGMAVFFLEFFRHVPERGPARACQDFLLGCNLAVRRRLFPQARFPEQTLGEDVLFSAALRKTGFQLLYAPAVTVTHWNRSGWREFWRYNRKMGQASADYHRQLQLPLVRVFLKFPPLVLLTPPVNCLLILWRLLFARRGLLFYYLLLLPLCLTGNLVWAWAFFQQIKAQQTAR